MFTKVSLFSQQFTIHFLCKFTHGDFLAGGEANLRIPELAATTSPSLITHTSFIECEICHVILKSVRDLGNHKRENYPPIVKQKVCSGTADQATPSPVSHGNQKPAPSPVLLPRQIPCPVCKVGCNDRQTLLGHVSVEHPSYKFMCNEANCFKVYISKSGLFKHKKPIFCRIAMTACYVWIVRKLSNVKMMIVTPMPSMGSKTKTEKAA